MKDLFGSSVASRKFSSPVLTEIGCLTVYVTVKSLTGFLLLFYFDAGKV